MHDDVYICLAITLLATPLARTTTRWIHPRTAAILLTGGAAVMATATVMALGILILGARARIDITTDPQHIAHRASLIRGLTAPHLATAAVIGLVAGCAGAAAFIVRRRRALAASFAHAESFGDRDRVVVTPDTSPDAYAVPGRPGRVVISAGMLRALDDADIEPLLAHEESHLDRHHHLYATITRLASAINPLLRPLAHATDFAIERWADEDAATSGPTRRKVAAAVSKAAIAKNTASPARRPSLALGVSPSRAKVLRSAGPIPQRVAALLAPAPRTNPVALAGTLAAIALSAVCAVEAATDLAELLSLAPGSLT